VLAGPRGVVPIPMLILVQLQLLVNGAQANRLVSDRLGRERRPGGGKTGQTQTASLLLMRC